MLAFLSYRALVVLTDVLWFVSLSAVLAMPNAKNQPPLTALFFFCDTLSKNGAQRIKVELVLSSSIQSSL